MRRQPMLALIIVVLLSACTQSTTPPQTLSQKLQGKTPEEKQEILRLACLNEAEYTTKIKKKNYQRMYGSKRVHLVQDTDETWRMKMICREMTDTYAEKG